MVQLIRKFLGSSVTMTGERIYQGNGFWTGDIASLARGREEQGVAVKKAIQCFFP